MNNTNYELTIDDLPKPKMPISFHTENPTICCKCKFIIEDIGFVRKGEKNFFITKESSPYCIVTYFEITDFVYGRGEEKVISFGQCKFCNDGKCQYFKIK